MSRLVDTFRLLFDDKFQYEGNRAIPLQVEQELPVLELKECIRAALTYHNVKHLEPWESDESIYQDPIWRA